MVMKKQQLLILVKERSGVSSVGAYSYFHYQSMQNERTQYDNHYSHLQNGCLDTWIFTC